MPDGTFCALPPPHYQQLLLLFRHKLMRRLLKLEKITETTVEILDRFRHPGFSAFQGPAIQPDDTGAREKLAIYMVHPPVALERIDHQQAGGVIFHPSRPVAVALDTIPKAAHPDGFVRLDPLEGLAALTDHIPDKGQHLVRFYGWYSNKNRGLRKKRTSPDGAGSMDTSLGSEAFTSSGRAPADSPDDDFRKECRRTWARMIKKVFEVDPLLCPRCGFPLRVLSCIEDPPVVRRILHHLGLWDTQQRPPPAPPQATEFIGGVLPQVAEDPYPYDQSGWASDKPA